MTQPLIATIELEAMVLARHLTLPAPLGGERVLDRSAFTILSCLTCGGPMSIGELSDVIGLEVSTLTRQTAAMRTAGLLDRIPDPDGGIARKFRITDTGRQRLLGDSRANMATLAAATADWTEDDLHAFAGYLERFNVGIEHLADRHWPRPLVHPTSTPEHAEPALATGGGAR